MIFEVKEKTGLKDIGRDSLVKDEAILEILEDAAGEHSNYAGYGALDIKRTNLSWIIIDWKIEIIKRPVYADEVTIKTWGRGFQRAFIFRDYEIFNSKGELCVKATSKWAMINADTKTIAKITNEVKDAYKPEDKNLFGIDKLEKINIPDEFSNEFKYKVTRKDIDLNNHMHNTYYLNLAYEALPQSVFEDRPFTNVRITYKHEIQLGDYIMCKYANYKNKHIVIIQNVDTGIINSIIELSK